MAKIVLSHVCIICSIVLLAVQVLDWYNPFMDFMGHSMFVLYALCIGAICLGIAEAYINRPEEKIFRKPKRK